MGNECSTKYFTGLHSLDTVSNTTEKILIWSWHVAFSLKYVRVSMKKLSAFPLKYVQIYQKA